MSQDRGWIHVAKKDLADAGRSKLFLGVAGILILLSAALSAVPYFVDDFGGDAAEASAALLQTPVMNFLPILGAMIGYMAIVHERDSGSIRVLLGLPLRRSDVIAGKAIGRSIVLVGALLIAGVVGVVLSLALYGTVDGEAYTAFGIIGVLLSVIYVSIAIAISASVTTRGKALAAVAGVLVLFVYAWQLFVLGVVRIVEGSWTFEEIPDYALFLISIDPGVATSRVANIVTSDAVDPFEALGGEVGGLPWYVDQWLAIPVVLLWIVGPLAIGYYRFANADL